ncbi:MAG: hypothetical protein A3F72_03960 [Bacteroidetes bacterium RIFCSPLOWO2_12_FULL_35_15]|nr:MAG: hypothetical protein A3F72_03960 [Bacteroidetes bacterium RIFCSPLOWO2_12_FULL_35_15]
MNFKMKNSKIFIVLLILFFYNSSFAQTSFNVDVLPSNVGGKAEFKRVFEQELIYPESSLKKKIGGKVVFTFSIMKDSSVTNIDASESGAPDINLEAMRLFKLYQWVPAIKEGKYTNSNWSVTFDFDPEKYPKICKQRGFTTFKYLPKTEIDKSGVIYTNPDQIPMYQKGNFALQDFIKENLEYPRQAQLSNIQGKVVVRFVVEPSGLVTNIGIDKSLGGGCDQEALRIIEMIKWYPGMNNEKLVRVQMTYPIYFVLNDEFKDNTNGEQK